jgi:hypothetical protein
VANDQNSNRSARAGAAVAAAVISAAAAIFAAKLRRRAHSQGAKAPNEEAEPREDARGEGTTTIGPVLTEREAIEYGTKIGALLGLAIEDDAGAEEGAVLGAQEVATDGRVRVFTEEEGWDVLEDIPNDSSAAEARELHDLETSGAARTS